MSVLIKLFLQVLMLFTVLSYQEPQVPKEPEKEEKEWRQLSVEEATYLQQVYEQLLDMNYEQRLEEVAGSRVYEDSWGIMVPDPMYMPQPDFGTLPGYSLFAPGWITEDGNFILGSSAVVKVNDELPSVGLTAFHCVSVLRAISGMDIPDYIQGGVLFDVYHPNEIMVAEIVKAWAMPNAESLAYGKDLAAFELDDTSDINVLPLADDTCEPGEVIWLYGYLISEDEDIMESCLYPCIVIDDDGTQIEYILSEEFDTNGASGSPLLNNEGEVVGIHIGSFGSIRSGHSAQSIRSRLIEAYEINK